MRILAAALLIWSLSGCSIVRIFNALVPTGEMVQTHDVSYGKNVRQRLDVYVPKGSATTVKPVIVFFYGGTWDSGAKEDYLFVAEALTSRGFIAVLPDYRVYPEVLFPDFLDDAAAAFAWTKTNIASYGGDPTRIFAMGHSAGAHIAAMLTYDAQLLTRAGASPRDIAGFIGLAGPYDFLPLKSERLKIIFGPPDQLARSQPINFVAGNEAPALLLHGTADTTVGPHNSANLAQRVAQRGGHARYLSYPGMNHRDLVVNLAAPFRGNYTLLHEIAGFVANGAGLRQ